MTVLIIRCSRKNASGACCIRYRYDRWVMDPNVQLQPLLIQLESYGLIHKNVSLWYNIVCLYSRLVHTLLFGVKLRMTKNSLTLCITAYQTPNDNFTAKDASFYKNKGSQLQYMLHYILNWWCTLMLKLLRRTNALFYEFAAKQQKRKISYVYKILYKD